VIASKLGNAPAIPWPQLIPLGVHGVALLVTWVWLKALRHTGDVVVLAAAFCLTGLGLAMQFRLGVYADAPLLSMGRLAYPIGVAALLACLLVFGDGRAAILGRMGWIAYLGAIGALGAMLVLGRRYRGGIYLAGNLNPSEIVKPLMVVFLAAYLSERREDFSVTRAGIPMPGLSSFLPLLAAWAVPMAMVLWMHDLGLLILLNAVLVVMLFALTRKAGYLVLGGAGVFAFALLAGKFSAHAQARFAAWRRPFEDSAGKGWQLCQSLTAFYSGGMWGTGLGRGMPQSVPIVTSDFVYAAFGEEFGFLGCALLLALYAILFARGWRIASNAAGGAFGQLLGAGLVAMLALQTLLNVGGVTKAIPLTGITLPFLSQGGSSLAVSLASVGLLAALSTRSK
jgi:cell division protein FtsW (lipid II flippase)